VTEQGSRHGDGARLERKVRSSGRAWTVGDIVVVADGQWAVGLFVPTNPGADTVAERRAADGRRVEMTVEELARAIGAQFGGARRDGTTERVSALFGGRGGGPGRRVLVCDVRSAPEHGACGGVSERSCGDDLADEPEGGVGAPSEPAVGVGLVLMRRGVRWAWESPTGGRGFRMVRVDAVVCGGRADRRGVDRRAVLLHRV
jgi:hypothetical protein